MGRALRVDVADEFYHVINRANGKRVVFNTSKDYAAFEAILAEAVEMFDMRLYVYEIMPNHWHLVVSPRRDGDLARFVGWLTLTHTQRYHAHKGTAGYGLFIRVGTSLLNNRRSLRGTCRGRTCQSRRPSNC